MSELTKMKTYVLLEHMEPTAPIYIRVTKDKRVRISKIPKYDLHLKYTFMAEDNKVKTVRLKLHSNTIDQTEQIKEGIPANERFTTNERRSVRFTNGVLMTNHPMVQQFVESIPHNEKFTGRSQTIRRPVFKEYNQEKVSEKANESFKKNLAAANKIDGLSLAAAQEMLWRLNGTHYKVPSTLYACQNALVEYMDSSDSAVDEILKTGFTIDEEVTVTVGKLVAAGVLSFEAIAGQVSKKKNDQWIPVKAISSDLPFEERKRYFMEYLTTPNGLTLLADLKNDVDKIYSAPEDNVEEKEAEGKEVVSSANEKINTQEPAPKQEEKPETPAPKQVERPEAGRVPKTVKTE